MIQFFINGALKISQTNYEMRFLTETDELTQIRITMYDDIDNTTEHIQEINGLACIKIDCTDYLEKFNWQNRTYIRIKYVVDVKDQFYCKGSFPLISPEHSDTLKFRSVSCNNNKKMGDRNNYSYLKVPNSINMWSKLANEENDIIFHTGNQIYGDYLVDNMIGFTNMKKSCNTDTIYQTYANLYRTAYGERSQGQAMRNSLNIMVLNDHDIFQNFDTKKDDLMTPYYVAGMTAYLDYQHQLHNNLDYKHSILIGNKSIYYNLDYGKYHIVGLDERHEVYHNRELFSDIQLYWLFYQLTNNNKSNIIVLSPRPIGYLNKANAYIRGILSESSKDELLHPDNYDRTIMLLDNLNAFKSSKDIMLISGSGNGTFINAVYKTDDLDINTNTYISMRKPILRQLVSGPITRRPISNNTKFSKAGDWLQQKTVCFSMKDLEVSPKISVSNSNSYGIIERDQLLNNYIEEEDIGAVEEGCCSGILCFR